MTIAPQLLQQQLFFRQAVAADVDVISTLVESAYRGDASRAGWTTEADFLCGQRIDRAGIEAVIDAGESQVLLAECDARLIACCHIEKQFDACYFGMFAVDPKCQASGIGRLVMIEAERIAREIYGCREMEMTVITIRSELIAWYERRGYRRSGIYRPFPYGDIRYGIPQRDDLRFEVLVKPL